MQSLVTILDRALYEKFKFNGGEWGLSEQRFRSLPVYVQENLTCSCYIDFRNHDNWIPAPNKIGGGSFCKGCRKPHRYSVNHLFFTCEGCNNYGTYTADNFRYQLCTTCNSGTPIRPSSSGRRSGFKFG